MMKGMMIAAALAALPAAGYAADARHPYSNIDHRVDAGNDTGDSRVEALNAAQLQSTRRPAAGTTWVPGMATIYGGPAYPPRGYAPPPPLAYWPPPYPYAY
jgi:hypothetical protein